MQALLRRLQCKGDEGMKRKEVFAEVALANGDKMRVVKGSIIGSLTYYIEAKETDKKRGFYIIGRRDDVKEAIKEMEKRAAKYSA